MTRMQLIGLISPGALNPPLQEQKAIALGSREESLSAPGAIRLIRCIRGIRVEPLNLDVGPTVLETQMPAQ